MSNVASRWYYEGYDDCSFESPQAPGATQVRLSYHRDELFIDSQLALSGPTGIGRRRLNDQGVGGEDISGGMLHSSINHFYSRPVYRTGGSVANNSHFHVHAKSDDEGAHDGGGRAHSTAASNGVGGGGGGNSVTFANQSNGDGLGGGGHRRRDTADELTQRLRYENLILQHVADQCSNRERQKLFIDHMKEKLLLEEEAAAASAQRLNGEEHTEEKGSTANGGGAAPPEVGADGSSPLSSAPPRPLSPISKKAAEVEARHAKLLSMRAEQRIAKQKETGIQPAN